MKKLHFLLFFLTLFLISAHSANALVLDDVTVDENNNTTAKNGKPDRVTIKFHNYPDDITGNLKMTVNETILADEEYTLINNRIKSNYYILIDNSGSMKVADLNAIKNNVSYIIKRVGPKDRIEITKVNDKMTTIYGPAPYTLTADKQVQAIWREGNYSRIYDALRMTADEIYTKRRSDKDSLYYLLFFSDGEEIASDTGSRELLRVFPDVPLYYFCYSSDYKPEPNKPIVELAERNGKFYKYLDTNLIDSLFFSSENRYTLIFDINKKHALASKSYLIELSKKTTEDDKIVIDLRKYFDNQNGVYDDMVVEPTLDKNMYNNLKGNLRHDSQTAYRALPKPAAAVSTSDTENAAHSDRDAGSENAAVSDTATQSENVSNSSNKDTHSENAAISDKDTRSENTKNSDNAAHSENAAKSENANKSNNAIVPVGTANNHSDNDVQSSKDRDLNGNADSTDILDSDSENTVSDGQEHSTQSETAAISDDGNQKDNKSKTKNEKKKKDKSKDKSKTPIAVVPVGKGDNNNTDTADNVANSDNNSNNNLSSYSADSASGLTADNDNAAAETNADDNKDNTQTVAAVAANQTESEHFTDNDGQSINDDGSADDEIGAGSVQNSYVEKKSKEKSKEKTKEKTKKESKINWLLILLILLLLLLLLLLIWFIAWLIRKIADSRQPAVSGGRSSGGIDRTPVETYTPPPAPVTSSAKSSGSAAAAAKTPSKMRVKFKAAKDERAIEKNKMMPLTQYQKAAYIDEADHSGESFKIDSSITIIDIYDDYIVGASTTMLMIDDIVKIKQADFLVRRARYSNRTYTYEFVPVDSNFDIKSNITKDDNVVAAEKTVSVYGNSESIINKMLVPANLQIVGSTWMEGTIEGKNPDKILTTDKPLYLDVIIQIQEGAKTNDYLIVEVKYEKNKYTGKIVPA